MQPNTNSNLLWLFIKKYRLYIIIALVIFIIFVLFILLSRRETPRTPASYIAINIPSVGLNESFTNNKVLRFFNGRNFVDYDLNNGSTTKLLDDQDYPTLSELSWSPNGDYVIFKSSQHRKDDYLGKRLASQNNMLASSYWWIANIKNKKISYVNLSSVIKEPLWGKDNSLSLLSYTTFAEGVKTKEKITTQVYNYNLATNTISVKTSIPGSIDKLLWTGKNKNIYSKTGDNKNYQIVSADGSFKNPKTITTSNTPLFGVSNNGGSLYHFSRYNEPVPTSENSGDDEEEPEEFHDDNVWFNGSLKIVNTENSNETLVVEDLASNSLFAFDEDNRFWSLTTDPDADLNLTKHASNDTEKDENFIIKDSNVSLLDMIGLYINESNAYIKSSLGYGVVSDREIKSQDKKLTIPTFSDTSKENPFIINQSTKDLSVVVTIFSKPVEASKKKAINIINSGGVDANLLNVKFDDSPTRDITRN